MSLTDTRLTIAAPFSRGPHLTGVLLLIVAIAGYVLFKPKDAPVSPAAPVAPAQAPAPSARPCPPRPGSSATTPSGCQRLPVGPCGSECCPGHTSACPAGCAREFSYGCPWCRRKVEGKLPGPGLCGGLTCRGCGNRIVFCTGPTAQPAANP